MAENKSLSDRFQEAVGLVESSPSEAIDSLTALQRDVATLALFSPNEGLEDASTKSLPLLAIEFHLAVAFLGLPTPPGKAQERKHNVTNSMDLFSSFLQRLEQYDMLGKAQKKEFHELLEALNANDAEDDGAASTMMPSMTPESRDAKIARFKAKREAEQELQKLKALSERRVRLETDDTEEMDGYDQDSLERTLAIRTLNVHVIQTIEEWNQVRREVPMIEMMIQMESQRSSEQRHVRNSAGGLDPRQRPALSGKPLQLTHITKQPGTGELKIRKEEIQSQVFRPGWNQPTMSLEELGEREYQEAVEREKRQKEAEAQQALAPRRYEQLVKDGLEDNADLVDASAKLDREWDKFKDENPRGSGNKMGDRGDRNF
mmetsp:Transcript_13976/g.19639  ORF Transcript_13976/g.19639 Transcript_13976/m.19639 type:complete len:375 (-) Transcript_13976:33-1157(-)